MSNYNQHINYLWCICSTVSSISIFHWSQCSRVLVVIIEQCIKVQTKQLLPSISASTFWSQFKSSSTSNIWVQLSAWVIDDVPYFSATSTPIIYARYYLSISVQITQCIKYLVHWSIWVIGAIVREYTLSIMYDNPQ